ncbi:CUB domain-containing protein [Aphis craccivora]|uniref:CUB domain-containing protein n=1 Tax=Aphis craccivora TaxID=307492 RepID=A0A6G0YLA1_APHCR|nr:CUB domain-containing protein [Aphis craccivora]
MYMYLAEVFPIIFLRCKTGKERFNNMDKIVYGVYVVYPMRTPLDVVTLYLYHKTKPISIKGNCSVVRCRLVLNLDISLLFKVSISSGLIHIPFLRFTRACSVANEFACTNGRCIPNQLECDGFDHCGDNSDESSQCFEAHVAYTVPTYNNVFIILRKERGAFLLSVRTTKPMDFHYPRLKVIQGITWKLHESSS